MPFLTITVKFGDSEDQFEINTEWNVLFLKQRACQLFSLNSEECDLYLGASKLDEYSKISSTDVCGASVLLLIPRLKKNRFFVYCYECNEVISACLNWKCVECGHDKFVPSNSSRPERRVSGICSSTTCDSTQGILEFRCIKSPDHCPVVYLKHVHRNLDLIPCIACLSEDCNLIVTICEQKTHAVCLSCFKVYAKEYLEEGLFTMVAGLGYTLGCPAGCPDAFVSDPHHFRLIGRDFYARYKELSAARYMLTQDTAICPACGQHWDISSDTNLGDEVPQHRGTIRTRQSQWVTCALPAGCGALFCADCGWKYTGDTEAPNRCHCGTQQNVITGHQNSTGLLPIWASLKMNNVEHENRETIAKTCRPCPRCKVATEKAGGCNHMHCSRCGLDWCWICCDDWTGECQALHWL